MIIYPAIDISKGKIVRLLRGDFNKKKIYKNDLIEQVNIFESNGAEHIHVVDLDGALAGKNINEVSINKIIKNWYQFMGYLEFSNYITSIIKKANISLTDTDLKDKNKI